MLKKKKKKRTSAQAEQKGSRASGPPTLDKVFPGLPDQGWVCVNSQRTELLEENYSLVKNETNFYQNSSLVSCVRIADF